MDGIQTMREIRRSTVHHPGKWYSISLVMHLIAWVLIAGLSARMAETKAPVIIDLTLDPEPAAKHEATSLREVRPPGPPAATPLRSPVTPAETGPTTAEVPPPAPVPAPVSSVPFSGPRESLLLKAQGEVSAATAGRFSDGAAATTRRGSAEQSAATGHGEATPEKAKQRYLKEHFAYIRDLVMKSLVYPHQARKMGWSGKVTVSFMVCEDGTVREIKVLESSGRPMLDRCAIETIRSVAPFPRPPLKAEIVIPVMFKLM